MWVYANLCKSLIIDCKLFLVASRCVPAASRCVPDVFHCVPGAFPVRLDHWRGWSRRVSYYEGKTYKSEFTRAHLKVLPG